MNLVTLPGASPNVTPALAKFLARRSRPQLEAIVEVGIAMLDEIDGDPDAEDDDPGGGNVEDTGELVNEDGEDAQFAIPSAYGVDQSLGPITEARRLHMRLHMRQLTELRT